MAILKAEGRKFPTQTQVLVIGAGACGTIAALAAKENGAEAVILERDAKPSGSTSLSSGQIPAAGTKLQRAAGLMDDTPELLYQDILHKAHGECDAGIARVVANSRRKPSSGWSIATSCLSRASSISSTRATAARTCTDRRRAS